MNPLFGRNVRKIHPRPDQSQPSSIPFAEALSFPNLVLLGDPGAGKTTLFGHGSTFENAKLFHARSFAIYADKAISGGTVYIDALDEKRSRGENPDSISGIVEKLVALKPSKVRISCRSLEWLGDTDLALFKPYFESNGGYAVVELEKLSKDEQFQMLSGLGVDDPERFIEETAARGLQSLLSNPQNLLMLEKAVQGGKWPSSRFETFDKAIKLLLVEHNSSKQAKSLASHSLDDLELAAGAACASMLISDARGVSLQPSSSVVDIPAFDQVPYQDHGTVFAALQSRVFEHVHEDVASASHRTVAEFLAAKWLSGQITNGLPLDRLLSLITIDGYPALELRGIYAWLPNFLPSHAARIIKSDPMAIILYGDPRSFSAELRRQTITSIQFHSAHDPWFYGGDIDQGTLGNLSDHDMVEVFRSILSVQDDNYRLRMLVLDAIRFGPAIPELLDDMLSVLADRDATFVERELAFHAALTVSPDGAARVADLTKAEFLSKNIDCQLAANIIQKLYPKHFKPEHIAVLVDAYLSKNGSTAVGELWFVHEGIPDRDLFEVLDHISDVINTANKVDWRTRSEVGHLLSNIITRSINLPEPPNAQKLYRWLSSMNRFESRNAYRSMSSDGIKAWLQSHPDFVGQMFDNAFDDYENDRWWVFWHDFRGVIFYTFDLGSFAPNLLKVCYDGQINADKRKTAFSLLITYSFQSDPVNSDLFDTLYQLAVDEPFKVIFENAASTPIDAWHHEDAVRTIGDQKKIRERRDRTREDFDKTSEQIRNGSHLGWMKWISYVYFAKYSDTDSSDKKRDRLVAELGCDRADIAEEGMRNLIVQTAKLPDADAVLELRKEEKYQQWWYAVIGGLDLAWRANPFLDQLSNKAIEAGLAIELFHPVWDKEGNQYRQSQHGWIEAAYIERQSLVLNVLEKYARFDLDVRENSSGAIHRLTHEDVLRDISGDVLFALLRDYPNAAPNQLRQLVFHGLKRPELHENLKSLATSVISDLSRLDEEQLTIWLAAIFALDHDELPDELKERIEKTNDTSILWAMKTAVSEFQDENNKTGISGLSSKRIGFLAELFGERFPIEEIPEDGWSGDQNNWNANQYVRHLLNELSSRTDETSIDVLRCLSENSKLIGYRQNLLHAMANQATLYRQERFVQPSWRETVDALRNGRPANMQDLLSLTIDHLRSIEKQFRNNNIDTLKVFWNEDSYGRLTDPKSEETARDALVGQLRPVFEKQHVRVEPEGHMNQDKRADVVVLPPPGQKLPVELKRDYHGDVWSACQTQLDRLYTRDPESEGYGVYLVFWYGGKRPRDIPKPPETIAMPISAKEMEVALTSLIPADKRNRLKAVVIDVTQVV